MGKYITEASDEKMKKNYITKFERVMYSLNKSFKIGGQFGGKDKGMMVDVTPSKSGSVLLGIEIYPDVYIEQDKTVEYDSIVEAAMEFFFADPTSSTPSKLNPSLKHHIPGFYGEYKSYKIETVDHKSDKLIIEIRFYTTDKGTPIYDKPTAKPVTNEDTSLRGRFISEASTLFDELI